MLTELSVGAGEDVGAFPWRKGGVVGGGEDRPKTLQDRRLPSPSPQKSSKKKAEKKTNLPRPAAQRIAIQIHQPRRENGVGESDVKGVVLERFELFRLRLSERRDRETAFPAKPLVRRPNLLARGSACSIESIGR